MTTGPLLYRLDDHVYSRWIILDRDGTLNRDTGYPSEEAELEVLPGVTSSLSSLHQRGWGLAVASNQGGIALGYFSLQQMESFNIALVAELAKSLVPVSAIAICPHHPAGSDAAWGHVCACRKPAPGLVDALVAELSIDVRHVVFVGNTDKDREAATRAGVRFYWGRDEAEWAALASSLEDPS